MRKESGFSLLELLSVVTIVGALSAASIPRIITAVQSYRLNAGAQQVVEALQAAKFAAIQANASRMAYFNTSTNATSVGTSTAAAAIPLPSGVTFTTITGTAPSIVSTAATNAATIGGQQSNNALAAVSFPVASGSFYQATFSSRGLTGGSNLNPGTVHWVYLKNTNNELMAVTLTSAGSIQTWRWSGSAWSTQ